jgi:hypothetical protein
MKSKFYSVLASPQPLKDYRSSELSLGRIRITPLCVDSWFKHIYIASSLKGKTLAA